LNVGELSQRSLVVAVAVLALAAGSTAVAGEKASVPNFSLKNLDGKDVSLESLRAKGPVILDFWATWCKPCLRELPHVEELREEYGSQGLQVVAISIDDTRSLPKVKSYVKTHRYGFEVLLDTNKRTLRLLQGSNVPYLIVVAPTGENLYTHSGYRDGDEKELRQVVEEAMAEYAPPPPAGEGEGESDAEAEEEEAVEEAGEDAAEEVRDEGGVFRGGAGG
jgi:thiol-disulfide isomerase/thioredoxin